jgi:hypothetical protein
MVTAIGAIMAQMVSTIMVILAQVVIDSMVIETEAIIKSLDSAQLQALFLTMTNNRNYMLLQLNEGF